MVAAAVFEVPVASFVSAIALARAIRYFGFGYLAIRYGNDAVPFLVQHKLGVAAGVIAFALVSYGVSRLILRDRSTGAAQ